MRLFSNFQKGVMEQIKTLSTEEINSLQVDSALRLLGSHQQLLVDLTNELSAALQDKIKADCKISDLKQIKFTITHNMRALECMVKNA